VFQDYAEEDENKDKECVKLALAAIAAENAAQIDLVGKNMALENYADKLGKAQDAVNAALTGELEQHVKDNADNDESIRKLRDEKDRLRKQKGGLSNEDAKELDELRRDQAVDAETIQRLKDERDKLKKRKGQSSGENVNELDELRSDNAKLRNQILEAKKQAKNDKDAATEACNQAIEELEGRLEQEKKTNQKLQDSLEDEDKISKEDCETFTAKETQDLKIFYAAATEKSSELEIELAKAKQGAHGHLDSHDDEYKISKVDCEAFTAEKTKGLKDELAAANRSLKAQIWESKKLEAELAKAKQAANGHLDTQDDDADKPLHERIAALSASLATYKKEMFVLHNELTAHRVQTDHSALQQPISRVTALEHQAVLDAEQIKKLQDDYAILTDINPKGFELVGAKQQINQLKGDVKNAESRLMIAQDEIKKLKESKKDEGNGEIEDLRKTLNKLQKDSAAAEKQCRKAKKDLNKTIQDLNKKIMDLERELVRKEKQLEAAEDAKNYKGKPILSLTKGPSLTVQIKIQAQNQQEKENQRRRASTS
jgi:chromosome segregation ATPase